jgi:hypothetical protein
LSTNPNHQKGEQAMITLSPFAPKHHTPGPWAVDPEKPTEIVASDGAAIASTDFFGDGAATAVEANAAFIVRACNAHGDLVAALEFVRMTFADMETSKRKGYYTECPKIVAAAIAKAAGGAP